MKTYKLEGYTFVAPSKRQGKKYDVYKKDKYITSFGGLYPDGSPYEQFKDRIGYYSSYDHNDLQRRKLYYQRHGKSADYESPRYFSHRFLW